MPVSIEELRPHLQAFDFPRLFVEGLGWDHFQGEPLVILVDDYEYALKPVAKKAEFAVFECAPGSDGSIPDYPLRRKIETQVTKLAFEHLIIFVDADLTIQKWQWVKRESGKPLSCNEQDFYVGQTGQPVLQRLHDVAFTLEDEARGIGIFDVTARVSKAFNVEKVTKRFYERFQKELEAFGKFIEGITAQGDRDWYASLMLNRMMFVYFVQKQGFLDGNNDYLRTKLHEVQSRYGDGRFQQFYREFLLKLFHYGLGKPVEQRNQKMKDLLGRVPFLNGGLFDVHDLERDNPDISIPDAAFERVFDFFDGYRWHLDERPYREDNEINPDVLGYIFEKYVNQKQMGAYYTKEDITGYISRNTVIPFLFDAAKKECPVAFEPDGGVWRLLRDDPDRYIYPAVGHGITWNARQPAAPKRLEAPLDLPPDIAAGISDVSQRGGWNAPAPDDYALPTETWREVVARRQRYDEVKAKLASVEVQDINDLITLNLDVERFARDVIAQSEGPELLRAFWHALYGNRERNDTGVSVLDPTCGSGAFLFAALNVLEPLYTACLEGMRGFLDDEERLQRRGPDYLSDFKDVLGQVEKHPSPRYFILKSIVLNNLYGVDIMEEAVEICKLRLFLKLVAQLESYDQIEPLPDIDFNIRTGNTLVGFTSLDALRHAMTITRTQDRHSPEVRHPVSGQQRRQVFPEDQAALARINEEAEIASAAFNQFRWQQTMLGGEVTAADKQALRDRLRSLGNELDRYLATEYGIDPADSNSYDAWRASHQPFHWFAEFYGVMSKGGFDVVIGNPPYVEYSKVRDDYTIRNYVTEPSGNLYAFVLERSKLIAQSWGNLSMIVPVALVSTQRMTPLQHMLETDSDCWYSNYSMRPGKLFDLADQALTIFVSKKPKSTPETFSTAFQKWHSEARDFLFPTLAYNLVSRNRHSFWIPKFGHHPENRLLEKVTSVPTTMSDFVGRSQHRVFYRNTGGRYWKVFTDFAPAFILNGVAGSSSRETTFSLSQEQHVGSSVAVLSSSLFWWWYTVTSNMRDLNPSDWQRFPVAKSAMDDSMIQLLGNKYIADIQAKSVLEYSQRRTGNVANQLFKVQNSKPIIDEIDRVLAEHYGFTEEELDFIINYDIKYRMGREG